MSKKRKTPPPAAAGKAVSLERANRLFRLLKLLDTGAKTRAGVLQRLRIDIRTFYRDLELLRECAIVIQLEKRKYSLDESAAQLIPRLPFPDPGLTLGEAQLLAKGRTAVHKRLRGFLEEIMK
jgi:predicted DNA-binding transcriptional regulator YafY